jgi:hypothetical protein
LPFLRPLAFQLPGVTGDFPSHIVKSEAAQKGLCQLGFVGPHPGIHLGYVNRATGKEVVLAQQLVKEFGAAPFVIDRVDDQGGVEQENRH